MTITTIIFILLGVLCGAIVRIYKAKKSGLFYYNRGSKSKPIHDGLRKYNDNIHYISSPANYFQQFMVFFFILAIVYKDYGLFDTFSFSYYVINIGSAFLIAIGQSNLASYHWQIWINRGCGLPDIDPNENHKSEFAWGKFSFWFSSGKFFNGKRSILLIFVGIIEISLGIFGLYI
mgnify:CR=1 FL=1